MPLHLELALICQVCDETVFVESVDHGPTKNGVTWLSWTLDRAARHQAGECKGKRNRPLFGQTGSAAKKPGNA